MYFPFASHVKWILFLETPPSFLLVLVPIISFWLSFSNISGSFTPSAFMQSLERSLPLPIPRTWGLSLLDCAHSTSCFYQASFSTWALSHPHCGPLIPVRSPPSRFPYCCESCLCKPQSWSCHAVGFPAYRIEYRLLCMALEIVQSHHHLSL